MGDIDTIVETDNVDGEYLAAGSLFEEDRLVDGSTGEVEAVLPPSAWFPSAKAFTQYTAMDGLHSELLKQGQRKNIPIVARLTVRIKETFKICNPGFAYSEAANPRCQIPLTKPPVGVSNDGHDNTNSDLILYVNAVLVNNKDKRRYIVKDMLGQGTFGQVVKCWRDDTNDFAAVKVIKNQPAYYHQALVEVGIVEMLNTRFDAEDKNHIVRLQDWFVHQGHLCIVFELLTYNLFELIKENQFRGLSINLVRLFTKQLLESLIILEEARVIHCDLKPENILLKSMEGEIKLIDFGSACLESKTVYSYIQSRFYRSPEVLLGHAYTTAIDMWSLGCVAAELFLGLPLFPGASEYDLMQRMVETLGCQPPDNILRHAKQTSRFFKRKPATKGAEEDSVYTFLTSAEFEEHEKAKPAAGKRYFKHTRLEDVITSYSLRKGTTYEEQAKEQEARRVFSHFLRGLVDFDPLRRWTPSQAAKHPFITEEPFAGHWSPFPGPKSVNNGVENESRVQQQIPVHAQHQQQHQHPQLQFQQQQGPYPSPQFNGVAPYSPYGASYGTSYGSYGSYGEGPGSYGSLNNDANAAYFNYATPPGAGNFTAAMTAHGPHHMVGATPPDRRRLVSMMSATPQMVNGFISTGSVGPGQGGGPSGHAQLGMSPGTNPSFRPTSLGMSPSQFTPPGPHYHHALGPSSGQQGSPVRYGGPTSPLRGPSGPPSGGVPTSLTLGKAAAVGQYNKRRGRGAAVHPVGSNGAGASGEGASMQSWQPQQVQLQQQLYLGRLQAAATGSGDGIGSGSGNGNGIGNVNGNDSGSGSGSYSGVSTSLGALGAGGNVGGESVGRGLAWSGLVASPLVVNGMQTVPGSFLHRPLGGDGGGTASASQHSGGGPGSTGISSVHASGSGASSSTGAAETFTEGADDTSSPPDPGDWDPGYSDELLLEEGGPQNQSTMEGGGGISFANGGSRGGRSTGQGVSVGNKEGQIGHSGPGGNFGGGWTRNASNDHDVGQQSGHSRSVGASTTLQGNSNAAYHSGSLQVNPMFLNSYQSQQHPFMNPSQQHMFQQQHQHHQQQQQQQQHHQQHFFLQQQAQLQQDQHQKLLFMQQQANSQQAYPAWPWLANTGNLPQLASSAGGRDNNQLSRGSSGGFIVPGPSSGPGEPSQNGNSNNLIRSPVGSSGSGDYAAMLDLGLSGSYPSGVVYGQWGSAYPMSPPDQAMVDNACQNTASEPAPVGASPDRRGQVTNTGLRRASHGSGSLTTGRLPPAAPARRDQRRPS